MLVRRRTMSDTAKAMLCTLLAVLLAVTPLGSLAHIVVAGSDFRPDLCTAAGNSSATLAVPAQPASHSDAHAHCGDCSCGIGFAPLMSPGAGAVLIVRVPLDVIAAPAPVASLVGGIVAR